MRGLKPLVSRNKVLTLGNLADYRALRHRVRETLAKGRKRAEEAVEQEKVRTSWEVGKLIQEHILLNQERAGYGRQVLKRLSADIGISETELYYTVEFARTSPIFRTSGKLSWSQIQSLLAINEDEKREELIKRAERENWTVHRTRSEVRKLKAAEQLSVLKASDEKSLVPIKGRLDTYRIVIATAGPWKGKPALDLGFSNYYTHPSLKLDRFKEGDIVSVVGATLVGALPDGRAQGPPLRLLKSATSADLFTYRAYPFKITDGDTLWVLVDLGFGFVTQQHLRLRGIDAPEITTRDGKRAKRFVERSLRVLPFGRGEAISTSIIITSTKSDKYDRYLADLWMGEICLNQKLLDKGLAVRVTE